VRANHHKRELREPERQHAQRKSALLRGAELDEALINKVPISRGNSVRVGIKPKSSNRSRSGRVEPKGLGRASHSPIEGETAEGVAHTFRDNGNDAGNAARVSGRIVTHHRKDHDRR